MLTPVLATSTESTTRSRRRELALALLVLAASVLLAFAHQRFSRQFALHSIENVWEGTAPAPAQQRILMPALVMLVRDLAAGRGLAWTPAGIAMGIESLLLFALFYVQRAVLARIVERRGLATLGALAQFYVLPFHYVLPTLSDFWFVWDVPAALAMAGALLALQAGRWKSFLLVLVLATLNRETAIFLVVLAVFSGWGSMPAPRLLARAALAGGIWLALQIGLAIAFDDLALTEHFFRGALAYNLQSLRRPGDLLEIASSFGFLWIPLAIGWRSIRSPFARRALLVVPFYGVVALFTAVLNEVRIFGEIAPLVVLGTTALLDASLARRPVRAPDAHGAKVGSPSTAAEL